VTWELLRDATSIDVAVVRRGSSSVNLFARERAQGITQHRLGAGFFRVLGVPLALGREFTVDEDRPGGPPVAILSYELWQDVFGGDPAAIGQPIFLRGESHQVVGVAPSDFQSLGSAADVYTPVRPARTGEGGGANYQIVARIRDTYSWAAANAELAALSASLPAPSNPPAPVLSVIPLKQDLSQNASIYLSVLGTGGVLLLVIACVNLGALFLGRGRLRAPELATRMALGGSRGAIVRQLLTEGFVIGALGGATGLVVGTFTLRGLRALGGGIFSQWNVTGLDARMMLITAGIALFAILSFALIPAWRVSRLNPGAIVAAGGSRSIAGASRHWAARLLVVAEVTLGVVLVAAAGMFLEGMLTLQRLEPGFDPADLTVARTSLQDARYATTRAVDTLYTSAIEALRARPGIEAASVSLEMPYRVLINYPVRFADRPVSPNVRNTNLMYVTPGFFETLKIPVRAGRVFTNTDRDGTAPVAVVNQAFVRLLADDPNPIGRPLAMETMRPTIAGIVGDFQAGDPGFSLPGMSRNLVMGPPILFLPVSQLPDSMLRLLNSFGNPTWILRARPGVNAAAELERVVRGLDPRLPVTNVRRMEDVRHDATRTPRLFATFMSLLAGLALVLASIGLYGRREFGIRMALGATPGRLIGRVSGAGIALAAVGAAAGLGLAWLAGGLLQSLLLGVAPQSVSTLAGVAALLGIVASAAAVLPALAVLRIDPAKTLRE
jgi:predicted permease